MKITDYMAASEEDRAAARKALSRRADSATRRLRRMTEAEMAEVARARFPEAVKLRVAVDDGDDAWCMAVGIYGPRGQRFALDDYDRDPRLDRKLQTLVEQAWEFEGGKEEWPNVDDDDARDYEFDGDVQEIRLPRRSGAPAGDEG
ncbi:hypothetical protein [Micromonospora maritima]|uniref:hypothetical protein n=1 Tax=Micromonospora maritima TaxID=986711 RepID=UPI00157CF44D|nr:hypothetical protein [Micromonospora maritima]